MLTLAPGELHVDDVVCILIVSVRFVPSDDDVLSFLNYLGEPDVTLRHNVVEEFTDVGYAELPAAP
jgi:hypothetical protein